MHVLHKLRLLLFVIIKLYLSGKHLYHNADSVTKQSVADHAEREKPPRVAYQRVICVPDDHNMKARVDAFSYVQLSLVTMEYGMMRW
jgi:hypothetical protein